MGASMNASTPISPEQWPTPDGEWMQEHTHSAWLFGRATIPLKRHASVDAPLHMKKLRFVYAGRFQNTLLTERAGAATVDAGSVHHRRLPSASLHCSCGISFWSAGQRSVPSGQKGPIANTTAPMPLC
ncbi:MAG TPA: hypothetical protein VFV38_28515 [Ktedonobacteraceae bacterium]|nr:hypothetical protein [Ktedonobacteraceae bacterium]